MRLWLWLHWSDVSRNDAYKTAFPLYKEWGIAGVKIDFMDRDDQEMVHWYEKITRAAAEHQLMVNFHGAFKPIGIRAHVSEPAHARRHSGQRIQQMEQPRHARAQGDAAVHAVPRWGLATSRRADS